MSVVAWLGPAAPYQAPGWTAPPGAAVLGLQCQGLNAPTCGDIADGWLDGAGRRLPAMLASRKLDLASAGEVYLNAFSAGGSSVKRLCLSEADRAAIRVVVLADGMYTTDRDARGEPVPPEGFVLYALDALAGDHLLVATASSSPNKTYPNGSEVLDAVRREVERRSGRTFEPGGVLPLPVQPVTLWRLGNVVLADYQAKLAHGEHVSVLNAPVWESIVKPWLAGKREGPGPTASDPVASSGGSAAALALAFVGGAAVGAGAVTWWRKRQGRR